MSFMYRTFQAFPYSYRYTMRLFRIAEKSTLKRTEKGKADAGGFTVTGFLFACMQAMTLRASKRDPTSAAGTIPLVLA